MRSRFHLDAPGWYAPDGDVPHLPDVADAVWRSRVLDIRYRRWKEPTDVDRRLEPYGLVLKAGPLVRRGGTRTPAPHLPGRPDPRTRRDRTRSSSRPRTSTWPATGGATRRTSTQACTAPRRSSASPRTPLSRLTAAAARALADTGTAEPDGWIRAVLPIESLDHAHGMFLALGADVEVLEPPELRARLARTGRALAARYASAASGVGRAQPE